MNRRVSIAYKALKPADFRWQIAFNVASFNDSMRTKEQADENKIEFYNERDGKAGS